MTNRIAFVTGGTRGIGRAISEELAKKCTHVIAGYSSSDVSSRNWIEQLTQQGVNNISLFKADISLPDTHEKINNELIKEYGFIDILINNAGITNNILFKNMDYSAWKDVLSTNIDSLFVVTNALIDAMIKNNFGRIINISSVNGQKGQYNEVNYSTSKAGMIGFTKALAQEVAENNITVNTISPGYIDTELTATLSESDIDSIISNVPVKRLGTPYEIARVVAFLADDDSSFITGANFSINGGLYME